MNEFWAFLRQPHGWLATIVVAGLVIHLLNKIMRTWLPASAGLVETIELVVILVLAAVTLHLYLGETRNSTAWYDHPFAVLASLIFFSYLSLRAYRKHKSS